MRLTTDLAGLAGLEARVRERLDARLSPEATAPIAVALSGGGDSLALLLIAARWAQTRDRPLLALTVDHRLNSESAAWSRFAAEAARSVGASWRGLSWDEPKPASGLTAAARAARHRLIAEAAREAGARVVLFAHTADDIAEGDWMRAGGTTLGRLREWSPSPVWPEGRGLMLLRPLLAERRSVLRDWLSDLGARWIDDPANADPRFGRSRARLALAGSVTGEPHEPRSATPWAAPGPGVVQVGRDVDARTLAAALVCAGGGSRPLRGDRLAALLQRLGDGEAFTATLAGARLEAAGDEVLIMREAGEMRRRPAQPLRLDPGRPAVWDGRFAFSTTQSGWTVAPALGRMAALEPHDRVVLIQRPAAGRGAAPVLIRDDGAGPVLADDGVEQRDLVPERLALALDETTHEDDLTRARWRNAVERPIFTGMTFRPAAGIGSPDDRGPL